MRKQFHQAKPEIATYVENVFQPLEPVLAKVREAAEKAGMPAIHVHPMDGRHLEVLARIIQPKRALEIGTLAGYSGICIARGLAPKGKLITLELDESYAKIARSSFESAGVSECIDIVVGPALESLSRLTTEGPFDLVFIDADKQNYPAYLDWAMEHLSIGGVIIGDNTFGWGHIADETFVTKELSLNIQGLKEFNQKLAEHPDYRATILPTGEGLTVATKIK